MKTSRSYVPCPRCPNPVVDSDGECMACAHGGGTVPGLRLDLRVLLDVVNAELVDDYERRCREVGMGAVVAGSGMGIMTSLAHRLSNSGRGSTLMAAKRKAQRYLKEGLNILQADECAAAFDLHPYLVWGDDYFKVPMRHVRGDYYSVAYESSYGGVFVELRGPGDRRCPLRVAL